MLGIHITFQATGVTGLMALTVTTSTLKGVSLTLLYRPLEAKLTAEHPDYLKVSLWGIVIFIGRKAVAPHLSASFKGCSIRQGLNPTGILNFGDC